MNNLYIIKVVRILGFKLYDQVIKINYIIIEILLNKRQF